MNGRALQTERYMYKSRSNVFPFCSAPACLIRKGMPLLPRGNMMRLIHRAVSHSARSDNEENTA